MSDRVCTTIVLIFMFMVLFFLGVACGVTSNTERMQRQAIEAGAAQWTVDANTCEPTFEYIKSDK